MIPISELLSSARGKEIRSWNQDDGKCEGKEGQGEALEGKIHLQDLVPGVRVRQNLTLLIFKCILACVSNGGKALEE